MPYVSALGDILGDVGFLGALGGAGVLGAIYIGDVGTFR